MTKNSLLKYKALEEKFLTPCEINYSYKDDIEIMKAYREKIANAHKKAELTEHKLVRDMVASYLLNYVKDMVNFFYTYETSKYIELRKFLETSFGQITGKETLVDKFRSDIITAVYYGLYIPITYDVVHRAEDGIEISVFTSDEELYLKHLFNNFSRYIKDNDGSDLYRLLLLKEDEFTMDKIYELFDITPYNEKQEYSFQAVSVHLVPVDEVPTYKHKVADSFDEATSSVLNTIAKKLMKEGLSEAIKFIPWDATVTIKHKYLNFIYGLAQNIRKARQIRFNKVGKYTNIFGNYLPPELRNVEFASDEYQDYNSRKNSVYTALWRKQHLPGKFAFEIIEDSTLSYDAYVPGRGYLHYSPLVLTYTDGNEKLTLANFLPIYEEALRYYPDTERAEYRQNFIDLYNAVRDYPQNYIMSEDEFRKRYMDTIFLPRLSSYSSPFFITDYERYNTNFLIDTEDTNTGGMTWTPTLTEFRKSFGKSYGISQVYVDTNPESSVSGNEFILYSPFFTSAQIDEMMTVPGKLESITDNKVSLVIEGVRSDKFEKIPGYEPPVDTFYRRMSSYGIGIIFLNRSTELSKIQLTDYFEVTKGITSIFASDDAEATDHGLRKRTLFNHAQSAYIVHNLLETFVKYDPSNLSFFNKKVYEFKKDNIYLPTLLSLEPGYTANAITIDGKNKIIAAAKEMYGAGNYILAERETANAGIFNQIIPYLYVKLFQKDAPGYEIQLKRPNLSYSTAGLVSLKDKSFLRRVSDKHVLNVINNRLNTEPNLTIFIGRTNTEDGVSKEWVTMDVPSDTELVVYSKYTTGFKDHIRKELEKFNTLYQYSSLEYAKEIAHRLYGYLGSVDYKEKNEIVRLNNKLNHAKLFKDEDGKTLKVLSAGVLEASFNKFYQFFATDGGIFSRQILEMFHYLGKIYQIDSRIVEPWALSKVKVTPNIVAISQKVQSTIFGDNIKIADKTYLDIENKLTVLHLPMSPQIGIGFNKAADVKIEEENDISDILNDESLWKQVPIIDIVGLDDSVEEVENVVKDILGTLPEGFTFSESIKDRYTGFNTFGRVAKGIFELASVDGKSSIKIARHEAMHKIVMEILDERSYQKLMNDLKAHYLTKFNKHGSFTQLNEMLAEYFEDYTSPRIFKSVPDSLKSFVQYLYELFLRVKSFFNNEAGLTLIMERANRGFFANQDMSFNRYQEDLFKHSELNIQDDILSRLGLPDLDILQPSYKIALVTNTIQNLRTTAYELVYGAELGKSINWNEAFNVIIEQAREEINSELGKSISDYLLSNVKINLTTAEQTNLVNDTKLFSKYLLARAGEVLKRIAIPYYDFDRKSTKEVLTDTEDLSEEDIETIEENIDETLLLGESPRLVSYNRDKISFKGTLTKKYKDHITTTTYINHLGMTVNVSLEAGLEIMSELLSMSNKVSKYVNNKDTKLTNDTFIKAFEALIIKHAERYRTKSNQEVSLKDAILILKSKSSNKDKQLLSLYTKFADITNKKSWAYAFTKEASALTTSAEVADRIKKQDALTAIVNQLSSMDNKVYNVQRVVEKSQTSKNTSRETNINNYRISRATVIKRFFSVIKLPDETQKVVPNPKITELHDNEFSKLTIGPNNSSLNLSFTAPSFFGISFANHVEPLKLVSNLISLKMVISYEADLKEDARSMVPSVFVFAKGVDSNGKEVSERLVFKETINTKADTSIRLTKSHSLFVPITTYILNNFLGLSLTNNTVNRYLMTNAESTLMGPINASIFLAAYYQQSKDKDVSKFRNFPMVKAIAEANLDITSEFYPGIDNLISEELPSPSGRSFGTFYDTITSMEFDKSTAKRNSVLRAYDGSKHPSAGLHTNFSKNINAGENFIQKIDEASSEAGVSLTEVTADELQDEIKLSSEELAELTKTKKIASRKDNIYNIAHTERPFEFNPFFRSPFYLDKLDIHNKVSIKFIENPITRASRSVHEMTKQDKYYNFLRTFFESSQGAISQLHENYTHIVEVQADREEFYGVSINKKYLRASGKGLINENLEATQMISQIFHQSSFEGYYVVQELLKALNSLELIKKEGAKKRTQGEIKIDNFNKAFEQIQRKFKILENLDKQLYSRNTNVAKNNRELRRNNLRLMIQRLFNNIDSELDGLLKASTNSRDVLNRVETPRIITNVSVTKNGITTKRLGVSPLLKYDLNLTEEEFNNSINDKILRFVVDMHNTMGFIPLYDKRVSVLANYPSAEFTTKFSKSVKEPFKKAVVEQTFFSDDILTKAKEDIENYLNVLTNEEKAKLVKEEIHPAIYDMYITYLINDNALNFLQIGSKYGYKQQSSYTEVDVQVGNELVTKIMPISEHETMVDLTKRLNGNTSPFISGQHFAVHRYKVRGVEVVEVVNDRAIEDENKTVIITDPLFDFEKEALDTLPFLIEAHLDDYLEIVNKNPDMGVLAQYLVSGFANNWETIPADIKARLILIAQELHKIKPWDGMVFKTFLGANLGRNSYGAQEGINQGPFEKNSYYDQNRKKNTVFYLKALTQILGVQQFLNGSETLRNWYKLSIGAGKLTDIVDYDWNLTTLSQTKVAPRNKTMFDVFMLRLTEALNNNPDIAVDDLKKIEDYVTEVYIDIRRKTVAILANNGTIPLDLNGYLLPDEKSPYGYSQPIHTIDPLSSVKLGNIIRNDYDQLADPTKHDSLNTFVYKMSSGGYILDLTKDLSEHETDIALSTQLLQVVGLMDESNVFDTLEVYELIAEIARTTREKVIKDIDDYAVEHGLNEKEGLRSFLKATLSESLEHRGELTQSYATASDKNSSASLPLLSRDLLNNLTTAINSGIRLRVKGFKGIQLSGHNLIPVYEDANGLIYTGLDLIRAQKRLEKVGKSFDFGVVKARNLKYSYIKDGVKVPTEVLTPRPYLVSGHYKLNKESFRDIYTINVNINGQLSGFEYAKFSEEHMMVFLTTFAESINWEKSPILKALIQVEVENLKQHTQEELSNQLHKAKKKLDNAIKDNDNNKVNRLIREIDNLERALLGKFSDIGMLATALYTGAADNSTMTPELEDAILEVMSDLAKASKGIFSRIPGTGKNSSEIFQIVGYIDSNANGVYVPALWLGISGSDSDGDSLQMWQYDVNKDVNNLENSVFNFVYKILSKGVNAIEFYSSISTESTEKRAKLEASKISNNFFKTSTLFLSDIFSRVSASINNGTGTLTTGAVALQLAAFSSAYQTRVLIEKHIKELDSLSNPSKEDIELSSQLTSILHSTLTLLRNEETGNIAPKYDRVGKPNHKWIETFLNSSIDNPKILALGALGINIENVDIEAIMSFNGISENDIMDFFTNPLVKEIFSKYSKKSGIEKRSNFGLMAYLRRDSLINAGFGASKVINGMNISTNAELDTEATEYYSAIISKLRESNIDPGTYLESDVPKQDKLKLISAIILTMVKQRANYRSILNVRKSTYGITGDITMQPFQLNTIMMGYGFSDKAKLYDVLTQVSEVHRFNTKLRRLKNLSINKKEDYKKSFSRFNEELQQIANQYINDLISKRDVEVPIVSPLSISSISDILLQNDKGFDGFLVAIHSPHLIETALTHLIFDNYRDAILLYSSPILAIKDFLLHKVFSKYGDKIFKYKNVDSILEAFLASEYLNKGGIDDSPITINLLGKSYNLSKAADVDSFKKQLLIELVKIRNLKNTNLAFLEHLIVADNIKFLNVSEIDVDMFIMQEFNNLANFRISSKDSHNLAELLFYYTLLEYGPTFKEGSFIKFIGPRFTQEFSAFITKLNNLTDDGNLPFTLERIEQLMDKLAYTQASYLSTINKKLTEKIPITSELSERKSRSMYSDMFGGVTEYFDTYTVSRVVTSGKGKSEKKKPVILHEFEPVNKFSVIITRIRNKLKDDELTIKRIKQNNRAIDKLIREEGLERVIESSIKELEKLTTKKEKLAASKAKEATIIRKTREYDIKETTLKNAYENANKRLLDLSTRKEFIDISNYDKAKITLRSISTKVMSGTYTNEALIYLLENKLINQTEFNSLAETVYSEDVEVDGPKITISKYFKVVSSDKDYAAIPFKFIGYNKKGDYIFKPLVKSYAHPLDFGSDSNLINRRNNLTNSEIIDTIKKIEDLIGTIDYTLNEANKSFSSFSSGRLVINTASATINTPITEYAPLVIELISKDSEIFNSFYMTKEQLLESIFKGDNQIKLMNSLQKLLFKSIKEKNNKLTGLSLLAPEIRLSTLIEIIHSLSNSIPTHVEMNSTPVIMLVEKLTDEDKLDNSCAKPN